MTRCLAFGKGFWGGCLSLDLLSCVYVLFTGSRAASLGPNGSTPSVFGPKMPTGVGKVWGPWLSCLGAPVNRILRPLSQKIMIINIYIYMY